jgi:hypothetical protein
MRVRFDVLLSCLGISYVDFSCFKCAQENYCGIQVLLPLLNQNERCTSCIAKDSTFIGGVTALLIHFTETSDLRTGKKNLQEITIILGPVRELTRSDPS